MRYHEIQPQGSNLYEAILTEAELREGFLDSIRQKIGQVIDKQVTNVNNMATALSVIYHVISNSEYLETATFLLKKAVKEKVKQIQSDTLRKAIARVFPSGRGMKDFLVALCLVGLINSVIQGAIAIKDNIVDSIKDSLIKIPNLLGTTLDVSGLTSILNSLQIANDIFFELLTKIHKKITA